MARTISISLLFAVLLSFAVTPADARTRKKQFGYGLGVGVAYTNAWGNYVDQEDLNRRNDSGLLASLFGIWNVNPNLSFQPALQFSDKGFEYDGEAGTAIREIGIDARYIEVPLLVFWDFQPKEYISPHVFGGLVPGFLLDQQARVNFNQEGVRTAKVDVGNMNTFTLEFAAGARLSFPAHKDRGYMELRTQFSLLPFLGDIGIDGIPYSYQRKEVNLGSPGEPDARHFLVAFSIGFLLD